jgi:hypothetical protein
MLLISNVRPAIAFHVQTFGPESAAGQRGVASTLITSRPGRNDPRELLPRSYDLSVRVQGAANVDLQGGQRAFDQILHAALCLGHRGGLVNAQRFLEQINRLIARAVERLDELLHARNTPSRYAVR